MFGLILNGIVLGLVGCQSPAREPFDGGILIGQVRGEPIVRVRVYRNLQTVRVDGNTEIQVRSNNPKTDHHATLILESPLVVRRHQNRYLIQSRTGSVSEVEGQSVVFHSVGNPPLRISGSSYPNDLVLQVVPETAGAFDVINHVPMEDYLPGVLDRELFSSWLPATYEALSVAARSYAIVQIGQSGNRYYDLESTTKSQVYSGVTSNARALDAVKATRGLVLTWQGQLFPTFYSSSCGGVGQDGPAVMVHSPAITPLMGRVRDGCCNNSPHFRWGPLVRNRQSLSQRIANWGRTNHHPVASVGAIAQIMVGSRNRAGRPTRFVITSTSGKTFELGAEEFRFASNEAGQGLSPLPAVGILKSSFVEVRVVGDDVRFFDGRGFGHGVGLCQYGAESLAQRGYNWRPILDYFYTGAKIERAYK